MRSGKRFSGVYYLAAVMGFIVVGATGCDRPVQDAPPAPETPAASPAPTESPVASEVPAAVEPESLALPLEKAEVAGSQGVEDRLYLAGIENPQSAEDFVMQLRSAARQGDRPALANLVQYPFTTYNQGTPKKTYADAAELLQDFDAVFTETVLTEMRNAQYKQLFINDQGAMLGRGEVWFKQYEDGIKIKAING